MLIGLVLLGAVIAVYFFWPKRPAGSPPGPTPIPIIGAVDFIGVSSRKQAFAVLSQLPKRFGDVVGFYAGGMYTIYLHSLELIKEVIQQDAVNGRMPGFAQLVLSYGERRGVIFTEGCRWKKNAEFLRKTIDYMLYENGELDTMMLKEIDDLFEALTDQGDPPNINDLFRKYYVSLSWHMITGSKLSSTEAAELTKLYQAEMAAFQNKLIEIPLARRLFPDRTGILDVLKFRDAVRSRFIRDMTSGSPEGTFVSRFRSLQKEDWRPEDDEDLVAFFFDFMTAGCETSSSFCEWSLLFLIKYPEYQERIRREIAAVVGGSEIVHLKDHDRMPLTQAFLSEVLRKSSISPLSVTHRVVEDFNIGQHRIPCGAALRYDIINTHMDPARWENPDQFDPGHFMKDGKFIPSENMIVFGVGPRRCTGESLAYAFTFSMIANLVRKYNIGVPEGDPPPTEDFDIGLVRGCLPFQVTFTAV